MAKIDTYLFDWGDTLMVDFPNKKGKMCEWDIVRACDGAKEALASISKQTKIYIATGAADSTEHEIEEAFKRVGLSEYITGYFCKANLGFNKGEAEFLPAILTKLGKTVDEVTIVGDNFGKDIKPAFMIGIKAVWLSKETPKELPHNVYSIKSLYDLI